MQAYVSRKQLLTFFIDSCYLLEGYEEIERTLVGKLEKNEVKLQDLLKDYRERQKFQSLISMLIVASHYYFEKGEHHLATICLIECQCILENLDKDNLLKVYLLVELGFISNPIDAKISIISLRTKVMGCKLPSSTVTAGREISIFSAS